MDKKIREDRERISNIPETLVTENDKTPRIAIETSLMLPYRGQQGEKLLKSLSKTLNHFLNFSIKDTTLKEHQQQLILSTKLSVRSPHVTRHTSGRLAED